jgi:hypothetical protein
MQLNKYDLVEYLSSLFDYINCSYCPIKKECDERKEKIIICSDEEKIRKTLIKKYNL